MAKSVYSTNRYKGNVNSAWTKVFKFIKKEWRVLDIGCSSGYLGKALKERKNTEVIGVDINKDDIQEAKQNLDQAYVLDLEKESLPKIGMFDAIIMADVIEHLVDPVAVLKKLKKHLKPGGRLVFSIPNMTNVTVRVELLQGRFEYKEFGLLDKTHIHFYDQEEVERVLSESGFEIQEYDCTIKNIPDDILKKELQATGIELTDKLKKHLNDPSARIYQFIGYAEPKQRVKHKKPKSTSPQDVVAKEVNHIQTTLKKEKAELKQNLEANIKKLESQKRELNKRLADIENSKGWRLLTWVREKRDFIQSVFHRGKWKSYAWLLLLNMFIWLVSLSILKIK